MCGFAVETGFSWSSLYGPNCPTASSGGVVLRNCGLVQTTGVLFDCLSNAASLKDEMFSLPCAWWCSQGGWLFLMRRAWFGGLVSGDTGPSIPSTLLLRKRSSPAKRSLWLSGFCPPNPKQNVLLSLILCSSPVGTMC